MLNGTTSFLTAKTVEQKVHVGLANKPSGCAVWVQFDATTMELGPFLFFGGLPGAPPPSLDGFKVAKHTKADADGVKKERPNIRLIPASKFKKVDNVVALYDELFGSVEVGTVNSSCIQPRKTSSAS